jgi:hypothetical protein
VAVPPALKARSKQGDDYPTWQAVVKGRDPYLAIGPTDVD